MALLGLAEVRTGDTLLGGAVGAPFFFERLHLQAPVCTVNVETETQAQLAQLEQVMPVLLQEDPSLAFRVEPESGQLLLAGMGELHLEVLQQRLRREFGIDAYYSRMRVNYRETVSCAEAMEADYEREVAGKKYHVSVGLRVEPRDEEDNQILVDKKMWGFLEFMKKSGNEGLGGERQGDRGAAPRRHRLVLAGPASGVQFDQLLRHDRPE